MTEAISLTEPFWLRVGLFRIFSDQSSYDDEGNWQVVQVKSLKLTEDGPLTHILVDHTQKWGVHALVLTHLYCVCLRL